MCCVSLGSCELLYHPQNFPSCVVVCFGAYVSELKANALNVGQVFVLVPTQRTGYSVTCPSTCSPKCSQFFSGKSIFVCLLFLCVAALSSSVLPECPFLPFCHPVKVLSCVPSLRISWSTSDLCLASTTAFCSVRLWSVSLFVHVDGPSRNSRLSLNVHFKCPSGAQKCVHTGPLLCFCVCLFIHGVSSVYLYLCQYDFAVRSWSAVITASQNVL